MGNLSSYPSLVFYDTHVSGSVVVLPLTIVWTIHVQNSVFCLKLL